MVAAALSSPLCVKTNKQSPHTSVGTKIGRPHSRERFRLPLESTSHLPVSVLPLITCVAATADTLATNPVEIRLGYWTESHSPRGIDAASHHYVACRKAECDNRPLPPDKVKRNLHFLGTCGRIPGSENRNQRSQSKSDSKPCSRE
jgi:hypothetical protein